MLVSWSIDEAACCRLKPVCSVRAERSWLPVAISALAVLMLSDECRICPTISESASCMRASEVSSLAASSPPLVSTSRVVRSLCAIAVASRSAASIGRQIATMFSSTSGTIATAATSPTAPISAITSTAVCATRAALASAAARTLVVNAASDFRASPYSGCALRMNVAATRAESKPIASSWRATGRKASRNLSRCAIASASC